MLYLTYTFFLLLHILLIITIKAYLYKKYKSENKTKQKRDLKNSVLLTVSIYIFF